MMEEEEKIQTNKQTNKQNCPNEERARKLAYAFGQ
jgi:hypothetical protein